MSSASYLDTFLGSVEDAPQDLRRNLQHMRALDTEAQEMTERIKKLAKVHVTRAKRSVAEGNEPSEEVLHKVRALHRKVEEIANEKVNMATQISEQMHRHLRRLNDEIGRFELELNERGTLRGQPAVPVPGGAGDEQDGEGDEAGGRKRAQKRQRESKGNGGAAAAAANANAAAAAAAAATPVAPVAAAVPPAATKGRPGAAGAAGASQKKRKEARDLELDLDLGPELLEEAQPFADALYPDYRLPVAPRDEAGKPLCGAIPPASGAPLHAGQKVAARISGKPAEGVAQEWILGTVLRQAGAGKYMVGDDDDATGATVHQLIAQHLVPLPLAEPPTFTRAHEYTESSPVLAMFPDTTCFYKANVAVAPSKRRERDYMIEFEDDVDADGRNTWRRVPIKYVVAPPVD